jgi:hypothetical protein
MTDIEQKALALINAEIDYDPTANDAHEYKALCRAIEQHEAFRQEVSGVMTYIKALYSTLPRNFNRFIIPAPKPDPLVEGIEVARIDPKVATTQEYADAIRAALDARGFEIREKSDD